MTTGEKIKRIRQHRGMTQKELGDAVGLTANRIAQYEMGYRVPKATLLEKIAEVFRISRLALLEPDAGYLSGVMETLFWMDEEASGMFRLTTIQFDDPDCWRDDFQEEQESVEPCLHGNLTIPCSTFPPTVLWTENGMLDNFFKEWEKIQTAYYNRRISHSEYFEWKLRWPMDSKVRSARELAGV